MFNEIKKGWLFAILFFSLILFLQNCKSSNELSTFDWIIGKWQINEGSSYEEWEKTDYNTFSGKSYRINNQDTKLFATMQLVNKGNEIQYIAIVLNQNDGKPIPFKLTSSLKNKFTFENPTHDFPKWFTYSQLDYSTILIQAGNEKEEDELKLTRVE